MVAVSCGTTCRRGRDACASGPRHVPWRARQCPPRRGEAPSEPVVVGRYYDPPTGQFLSVDPLVRQTQQPYLYAADNPVKFSDPTGLTWHLWMEQWLESGSNWTARGSFRSQTGYSTEAIIEVTGASSTPFYVVIDDNDPGSNLHRYHGAMRLS
jgi:uncharacterized protein RhaS with RHS repeats